MMKRYLISLIACVCASIGAWADVTITNNKSLNTNDYVETAIRIETTTAGDISSASLTDQSSWAKMVFVSGPVNEADITALNTAYGSYAKIINLTQTTGLDASWLSQLSGSAIEAIGLPDGYTLNVSNENIKVVYSSAFSGIKNSANEDKGDDEIDVYVQKSGGIATLNLLQSNNYLLQYRTINLSGASNTIDTSSSEYTTLSGYYGITINRVVAPSNDPYTVDGCNVSINLAKAEAGQTLADLIALAKAKVIEGGGTGICTLTVSGELSSNDITVGLSSSAMDGATRIDLSGATLASGVILTSLNIPSSLTSLVLPKDQTVSVGLATKLADATNLMYAYSPSSSTQDDSQAIADYIWVNKPGGLKQAADEEATIRTAVYVKIESKEALNEDDAKFGSMGISATTDTNYPWQYVDMSGAVVTAAATLAATAPHAKGYRIILPDNLTGDNMAIFASNPDHGNIAALYSYSGTTLRILEITDGSYKESALHDSRIVFPGTDAIEIVSGSYNDTKYGTFGQTSTTNNNLLAAINKAESSIKSVTISDVTTASDEPLTFTNTNLTNIQLDRVKSLYDGEYDIQGPIINVNSCTSLQTLNLINCQLKSVTAQNSSITSITLNGTGVNADTNLSGSGLKTLTTNSDTWIQGDLHLESTASFTSFASTAKFGVNNATNGNIYLNASGVSTVDLQSVQFQNTSSKIHIHKTAGEDPEVLDALNAAGQLTIYIPTGFDRTRLCPYPIDGETAVLADNIAELAASGAFTLNDGCKIDYNATTGIATVTALHPGCFKALMEKDNNYGKFVDGAIFTFDASCKLNAADLAALAGKDGYGNFNWNYVDLYNLPASYDDGGTTVNYEEVITDAIDILRTNNWQYKGLLLPKTVQNIGTTLIMDAENADPKLATCSQFVAYSGAIGDQALTASYIYKAANDWGISFDERLTKMMAVMNLHNEIVEATTNWSVSTNSATPLDLSSIPASVTIEGNAINTSKLETINNDMVAGTNEPSIYAYPAYEGVMNTVTTYTGIGGTPDLETLKVTGPLNADDIASINRFQHGPRVFDLSGATTTITKAMLESITNANIEYIILPAGMTKEDVCEANYTTGLKTKLKAVISSTSTDLVAYVNTPGSLAEARYIATGGSIDANTGIISPTITGLQSVTLAGSLNAADIGANLANNWIGEDGHWFTEGAQPSIALSQEQGTIHSIDLKDAIFPNQPDMNFSYAGLSSLTDVKLPTAEEMTLICDECFMGIASLTELCVPYNYTKIGDAAFLNSYLDHLTTTDSKGVLIDNGEKTYTFSKNLGVIGNMPSEPDANGVYALSRIVFPQNRGVTDVYVLAHKTPMCYANAFPANMYYGWGGFKGGNFPYCREKYDNSTDGSMMFTVLHFPDKASFEAVTDPDMKEGTYNLMKQQYTDVNKNYSMKDQTGAVDSNGDAIAWPTFSELRRAYNQATDGLTWNDWVETYDINHEVNGGDNIPTEATNISAGTGVGDYSFAGYEGWHQFTLSMATYVAPDEKIVEDGVVTREYVEVDEWFTFCIPFSITVEQIKRILGVPASTDKVINKVYAADGTTLKEERSEGHNPEVRTLNGVTRQPGNTNKVTFLFTQPLVQDNKNDYEYWYINDETPQSSRKENCGNTEKEVPIAIQGGRPYIIKPYKLKGETITNLGKYVMERFRKEFTEDQSCGNLGTDFYEQLGNRSKLTSRFVKPYEKHKIQATALSQDGNEAEYAYHDDEKKVKYYYTFIGQFWNQRLPRYSFYVVNGKWYRLSSEKNYNWAPYKCIIMASQEVTDNDNLNDKSGSGKYRSADRSNIPTVTKELEDDDIFDGPFQLGFLDGLNDDDFVKTSGSRHIFSLDGDIIEYDEEGNEVTGITRLDGEDVTPTSADMKVYNLEGQFMGSSLESLSKGMYIVNGKKIVVK